MTPLLRVIPGGNADDAIPTAARSVAQAMAAEELRRLRQHVIRLEHALRAHGATQDDLDALRYGTTPPQPTVTADAPPPCWLCGEPSAPVHGRAPVCPGCAGGGW